MSGFLVLTYMSLTLAGFAAQEKLNPCLHGLFHGITQTSPAGEIIGRPDARDWGCAGHRGGGHGAAGSAMPTGRIADEGTSANAGPPLPPPTELCLEPAFPNPASSQTNLRFALPRAARVKLVVYGQSHRHGPRQVREVRTLVDAELAAGMHQVLWDLRDQAGASMAAGIYRAVLMVEEEALCGDIQVQ